MFGLEVKIPQGESHFHRDLDLAHVGLMVEHKTHQLTLWNELWTARKGRGGFRDWLEAPKSHCWCTSNSSLASFRSRRRTCVMGSGALGLPPLAPLAQATVPMVGSGKAVGRPLPMGHTGGGGEGRCHSPSSMLRAVTWAGIACLPVFPQVSRGHLTSSGRHPPWPLGLHTCCFL